MTDRGATAEQAVGGGGQEPDGAWAGYRLGQPIPLADFLALPADRERDDDVDRDERGMLCRMAADDAEHHRFPMAALQRVLFATLERRLWITPEPELAVPRLIHLQGHALPPSRLGRQTLTPDLVVFDGQPTLAPAPPRGRRGFALERVRVVIEVLSGSTLRKDLGLGRADDVDRWASFLASGVPELWALNLGVEGPCPLPPRSGLFLRNAGERWAPLAVDDPVHAPGDVHGLTPLVAGRVRSEATGATLDVGALWGELTPPS